MNQRDYSRAIDRLAAKLTAIDDDRKTLRQELIRAYIEIQALRKQLEDDGK